jgi:hypothetical protein
MSGIKQLSLPCTTCSADILSLVLNIKLVTSWTAMASIAVCPGSFRLFWDSHHRLSVTTDSSISESAETLASKYTIADGDWHTIIVTMFSSGHTRLYVDGTLMASGTLARPASVSHVLCKSLELRPFRGALSTISVHNADVMAHMHPNSAPIVLANYDLLATQRLWLLNEGIGSVVQSAHPTQSASGTGSIIGYPLWQAGQPMRCKPLRLQPGQKLCLKLRSGPVPNGQQLTIARLPQEGLLLNTNEDCTTWGSPVKQVSVLYQTHLVYIAPWQGQSRRLGQLLYVLHDQQVQAAGCINLYLDDASSRCRCQ